MHRHYVPCRPCRFQPRMWDSAGERSFVKHTNHLLRLTGLSLAALLAAGSLVYGQNITATMTGTVTDASGSVVPGANITLSNELSRDERKTVTNSAGYYTFAAVPAASFT